MSMPVPPVENPSYNTTSAETAAANPNKSYWQSFKEYFFPEETKDNSASASEGNSYWKRMRSWLGYSSPSQDSLVERESDPDPLTEDEDFEDSEEEEVPASGSFWSWLKRGAPAEHSPEEQFEHHFNVCAKQLNNNCDITVLLHSLAQLLEQFPQHASRTMILFDQLGGQLVDTAKDVIWGSFIDDQPSEDLIAFLYSIDAFLAYAETFPATQDTQSYTDLDRLIRGQFDDWCTAISYVGGLDTELSFQIMHHLQRTFRSPQMKRLITSVIKIYTQLFPDMFPAARTL